jgi:hypothetical protein
MEIQVEAKKQRNCVSSLGDFKTNANLWERKKQVILIQ